MSEVGILLVTMRRLVQDCADWWDTPARDRAYYALNPHVPPSRLLCSQRLRDSREPGDLPRSCETGCRQF